MNTKVREHVLALLIVALLLPGCMAIQPAIGPGQVLSLQQGSVIYGVQQAVLGKPGTLLLSDPTGKYFLASWPCSGEQAWAFVTADYEAWAGQFKGNIAQVKTWSEMKASLEALRWAPIGAGAVMQALSLQAVALISRALPLPLIVMPVLILDPLQMLAPEVGA